MSSMKNPPKSKKGKKPQSGAGGKAAQGAGSHKGLQGPRSGKRQQKDLHYHQTLATDVGKAETPKGTGLQNCGSNVQEGVERKDTMRRFALKGEMLHTLSRSSTGQLCMGAGAQVTPPLFQWWGTTSEHLYGQCPPLQTKHLIKFPIALEPTTLRSNKNNVSSPQSTQSVLLKADTRGWCEPYEQKNFRPTLWRSQRSAATLHL